jgi:hypothetical protein
MSSLTLALVVHYMHNQAPSGTFRASWWSHQLVYPIAFVWAIVVRDIMSRRFDVGVCVSGNAV